MKVRILENGTEISNNIMSDVDFTSLHNKLISEGWIQNKPNTLISGQKEMIFESDMDLNLGYKILFDLIVNYKSILKVDKNTFKLQRKVSSDYKIVKGSLEVKLLNKVYSILLKGKRPLLHSVTVDEDVVDLKVLTKSKFISKSTENKYFEDGAHTVFVNNEEIFLTIIKENKEFEKIVSKSENFAILFTGLGSDMVIGDSAVSNPRIFKYKVKSTYIKDPNDYKNVYGNTFVKIDSDSTTRTISMESFVKNFKDGFISYKKSDLKKFVNENINESIQDKYKESILTDIKIGSKIKVGNHNKFEVKKINTKKEYLSGDLMNNNGDKLAEKVMIFFSNFIQPNKKGVYSLLESKNDKKEIIESYENVPDYIKTKANEFALIDESPQAAEYVREFLMLSSVDELIRYKKYVEVLKVIESYFNDKHDNIENIVSHIQGIMEAKMGVSFGTSDIEKLTRLVTEKR